MTQTLIKIPKSARAGEVIEVATTIAHPMDSGYKPASDGKLIPRNILRSFTCQYDGATVFEAQFFPAISSNPFVSFHLRATRSGPVLLTWRGDLGFSHTETVQLQVT
jgi:sulfur-oxidizing protein SoxZ